MAKDAIKFMTLRGGVAPGLSRSLNASTRVLIRDTGEEEAT